MVIDPLSHPKKRAMSCPAVDFPPRMVLPARAKPPAGNFYCQMIQRHAKGRQRSDRKSSHPETQFQLHPFGAVSFPRIYGLHIQHLVNLIHAYCQVPQICSELHKFHQGTDAGGTDYQNINSSIISSWSPGCRYSNAQPETSRNASTGDCDGLICAENRRDTLQIDLPMLPVLLHQPCQAAGCRFQVCRRFFPPCPPHISENAASSSVEETVQVAPPILLTPLPPPKAEN